MSQFQVKNYSIHPKAFWVVGGIIFVFLMGIIWSFLYYLGIVAIVLFTLVLIWDSVSLFTSDLLRVERSTAKILSLGDSNRVRIKLTNLTNKELKFVIIEELPFQLQIRDFQIPGSVKANEEFDADYDVLPSTRGEYDFGNTIVMVQSPWALAERTIRCETNKVLRVYPSILQMKKFELASINKLQRFEGISKTRKVGHKYEFEQIKAYVEGDDYRSINWKATSRQNALMVNQYTDEQSQPVYCLIDKSRQMQLPFGGMSLLDYAINTSLVISNVALQKKDKVGLVTYGDKIDTLLRASSNPKQLPTILESLYSEQPSSFEANYQLLYKVMNSLARTRSLIFIFSNIESQHQLKRVLPDLVRIRKRHLLVVVFFKNTELENYSDEYAVDTLDIYKKTAAAKMVEEKRLLTQELNQYGIHTLLTRPDELTISTLNKYLEFKARGLI